MNDRRVPARHLEGASESWPACSARAVRNELKSTLTAIKSQMKSVMRADVMISRKPNGNGGDVDAQAGGARSSVREVPAELASVLLDTLGLAATIEWHLHEFRERTRIPYELTVNDDAGFNLPEEHATAIFHIYQEAVSNVARHAAASKVAVEVSITQDEVAMVVRDDGVGIAAVQARNSNLGGIANIYKRAGSHNGMCRISGAPDRGTTLSVRLPLKRAAG